MSIDARYASCHRLSSSDNSCPFQTEIGVPRIGYPNNESKSRHAAFLMAVNWWISGIL